MGKRYDLCPIGHDPENCPIRRGCSYWDIDTDLCVYLVTKREEQERRRVEKFDAFDEAQNTIRINKT
ncbi:hypothetical protein ES705_22539 [subsurface metagenome]